MDRTGFEHLYRATVGRTHALARRLLGAAEADEATQEVYLRAWRKRASFRGEAEPAAWLARLAQRELLNRRATALRRRERVPLDGSALEELPGRAPAPAEPADLERALADLPEAARAVFVLHEIEERGHAEIARELGISIGTSKSQLFRARVLLRRRLARTLDPLFRGDDR